MGEPSLLIVIDPQFGRQLIKETTYLNIPVLAICNTDCSLKNVDVAIPANNKEECSISVMFYFLSRMVLEMKGKISNSARWYLNLDKFRCYDGTSILLEEEITENYEYLYTRLNEITTIDKDNIACN